VLTICFSLGSVFYGDGPHFSTHPAPHVMKAYRKDVSAAVP